MADIYPVIGSYFNRSVLFASDLLRLGVFTLTVRITQFIIAAIIRMRAGSRFSFSLVCGGFVFDYVTRKYISCSLLYTPNILDVT